MNEKKGTVIFVSGVYGVGKSTLCWNLSQNNHLPSYSAGDLISKINGEKYGANKKVNNINQNQDILVDETMNILKNQDLVILAGHFCIMGENGKPEELPTDVYCKLNLSLIILLEANSDRIVNNLKLRDGIQYSKKQMEVFLDAERTCAYKISENLKIPLIIHDMKFDDSDMQKINRLLKEVYGEGIIRY